VLELVAQEPTASMAAVVAKSAPERGALQPRERVHSAASEGELGLDMGMHEITTGRRPPDLPLIRAAREAFEASGHWRST